jgi:recombination protein RecA
MKLNDRCKEIILGSLLGDGSLVLSKKYKKSRFEFRHSILQKDYFFWKVSELKGISGNKCARIQNADGWSKNKKLHYHSLTSSHLTELYHLTHRKGKFFISHKWLKELTPLSLLVWWLDDGSLIVNSRKGVFCTEGFEYQDILILSRYLRNIWKIRTRIGRRGKYYQLRIYSTEELKKFLRLILPHLSVANMLPKVIILYKDQNLQKRWISEVCEKTKFPPQVIEKYLEKKRGKWRNFRE